MDAKLKLKLDEAVLTALATLERAGGPGRNREPYGSKAVPYGSNTESKTLTRWLRLLVRNRLRKQGVWTGVQAGLVADGLNLILARKLRPRQSADENQLTFLMATRKNPAAVELGALGARARNKRLTAEERSEIARRAGKAGGRVRKKTEP